MSARVSEGDRRHARALVARLSDQEVLSLAGRRRIPPEREFIEACQIEDKVSGRLVPFALWPAQVEVLPQLQEKRLFALKARQLGFTWLDLAHWLYEATFWGNRLFLIARQTLEDALDAVHRLKVLRSSLPPRWQVEITVDKKTSLGFANGSRFRALTATTRMGRSSAAYGALLDEFCFWSWQAEQLASLEGGCERLHIVSSGNGAGDHAHALWQAAERGEGPWQRLFLPWSAHPGRDAAWYEKTVVQAIEPRLARREYAASPEEAFSSPEGLYFERFDSSRNVAEVDIVPSWQTVRCVDFGYHHPACAWLQVSPAGQPFVVAELLPERLTTSEFAQAILAKERGFGLVEAPRATYGDPAGRAVNVQTSESEVEVFRQCGLRFSSRPSGIRDGCLRLMDALADAQLPLIVSRTCPWTIEAFASVAPDRGRPEVYDETSPYAHLLDALRYWAVNRTRVSDFVAPPPMRRRIMREF